MKTNEQDNNQATNKRKKFDKDTIEKISINSRFVKIVDQFNQNENPNCNNFIKYTNFLKRLKKKTRKKYLFNQKKQTMIEQKSEYSLNDIQIDENITINDKPKKRKSTWRLITMMILNGIFFFVELIVGIVTHSLALQSDAFNMLSDLASVIIGFVVHQYSKKLSSPRMTFGYIRAETIGGLCNSVFMYAVSLTIFLNAIELFVDPHEIEHSLIFLIVGIIGLIVNLIGVLIFLSSDNDNIKGVFIHELGDFLGSIGVLISALVQNFCNSRILKMYIDPVISIIIAIILIIGTTGLFKKTIKIVAETVPPEIEMNEIKKKIIEKVPNIIEIHDFHIWVLTDDIYVAILHVIIDSVENRKKVLDSVNNFLIAYGIYSSTIQIEYQDDLPPIIRDKNDCCPFASQYNHRKRIFKSNPIYQHLVGCHHVSLLENDYEDNYDDSNDNNNNINIRLDEIVEMP